ncbi:MAG: hypothetical protein AB2693_32450 [Candidatus Thiodiazotropha sp.]
MGPNKHRNNDKKPKLGVQAATGKVAAGTPSSAKHTKRVSPAPAKARH